MIIEKTNKDFNLFRAACSASEKLDRINAMKETICIEKTEIMPLGIDKYGMKCIVNERIQGIRVIGCNGVSLFYFIPADQTLQTGIYKIVQNTAKIIVLEQVHDKKYPDINKAMPEINNPEVNIVVSESEILTCHAIYNIAEIYAKTPPYTSDDGMIAKNRMLGINPARTKWFDFASSGNAIYIKLEIRTNFDEKPAAQSAAFQFTFIGDFIETEDIKFSNYPGYWKAVVMAFGLS